MRIFVSALLVASSVAVGIAQAERPQGTSGQQPSQAQQPAAPREQPSAQREQPPAAPTGPAKVTISGCIESAPAAAAAGGGPPASTPAAAKFVLANAKTAGAAAGGAVGTAGAAATRYQLEGDEKTISPHVNHQVEITGTVQPASGAAAGAAATGPMLKVESVKMVAAKCS